MEMDVGDGDQQSERKKKEDIKKSNQNVDYYEPMMAMGHRIVSIVGRGVPLPASRPRWPNARAARRPGRMPLLERACIANVYIFFM